MVNLFWTALRVDDAVKNLVDSHVGSCVYEGAQICMHAAKHRGYDSEHDLWTHHIAHHPCIDYAAAHPTNWVRSYAFVERAHTEWKLRHEDGLDRDDHGAVEHLRTAINPVELINSVEWPDDSASPPPKVTVDWQGEDYYTTDLKLIESYRYYVANAKDHLHSWDDPRSEPDWIEQYRTDKSPDDVIAQLTHDDIRSTP